MCHPVFIVAVMNSRAGKLPLAAVNSACSATGLLSAPDKPNATFARIESGNFRLGDGGRCPTGKQEKKAQKHARKMIFPHYNIPMVVQSKIKPVGLFLNRFFPIYVVLKGTVPFCSFLPQNRDSPHVFYCNFKKDHISPHVVTHFSFTARYIPLESYQLNNTPV